MVSARNPDKSKGADTETSEAGRKPSPKNRTANGIGDETSACNTEAGKDVA